MNVFIIIIIVRENNINIIIAALMCMMHFTAVDVEQILICCWLF